jgi:hypothetical protein
MRMRLGTEGGARYRELVEAIWVDADRAGQRRAAGELPVAAGSPLTVAIAGRPVDGLFGHHRDATGLM